MLTSLYIVGTSRARARVAARKARFLEALAELDLGAGAVPQAAAAAGVARQTPYRWRAQDPAFARAWEALDERRLAERLVAYEAVDTERTAAQRRRLQALARKNFATWWRRFQRRRTGEEPLK
jgi:hypothetical protein